MLPIAEYPHFRRQMLRKASCLIIGAVLLLLCICRTLLDVYKIPLCPLLNKFKGDAILNKR